MVRKIQRSDKPEYMQLVRDFYAETDRIIPEDHIVSAYKEMMRGSNHLAAFVFINEGEKVGYALVSKTFSQKAGGGVWWIEELYVKPEYRGKGYATEFLTFLEANCPSYVKQLRIELDIDSETDGTVYDKLGFKAHEYCNMIRELNR